MNKELVARELVKIAEVILAAKKQWTRSEWKDYKLEHPGSEIMPKFKEEPKAPEEKPVKHKNDKHEEEHEPKEHKEEEEKPSDFIENYIEEFAEAPSSEHRDYWLQRKKPVEKFLKEQAPTVE